MRFLVLWAFIVPISMLVGIGTPEPWDVVDGVKEGYTVQGRLAVA